MEAAGVGLSAGGAATLGSAQVMPLQRLLKPDTVEEATEPEPEQQSGAGKAAQVDEARRGWRTGRDRSHR